MSSIIPAFADEFQLIENISGIYRAAQSVEGRQVICDSSHRTTQCRLLYELYGEELKIISLVRDGRAVVNSVRRRTGSSIGAAATRWERFHRVQKLMYRVIPDRNRLFIRYEDLCDDPIGTLKKICEFAQIKYEQADNALHFIGGSSTIRSNKSSVSTIHLDEKWRHQLTDADLALFKKVAGPLNYTFGYH